ncbi:MAG: 30S ribosome-binding factor RbfA [Chitinivibrionia bacterium]|jgi:ribosome-binding factor A|nr:30S ribosome-binding factor RbfA [Chitinivibrionia bacterium]
MPQNSWYGERTSENLRREILWVVANEMNDPRLAAAMITIPSINLAKDNRNATVFVSIMTSDVERNAIIKALNYAAGFIQTTAAKRVKMRHFPKLFFKLDKSFEHSSKIDEILERVKDDLE